MTATGSVWLPVVFSTAAVLAWRRGDVVAARDRALELRPSQRARGPLVAMVDRWITAAMVPISVREAVQAWLLCASGLIGLGWLLSLPYLIVCGGCALGGGPGLLWFRRNRRSIARANAVPELLRCVAAELRAGGTVVTGCVAVARSSSQLAHDMETLTSRLTLGASMESACAAWVDESSIGSARSAAAAMTLAHELGGPSAGALDGLAASLATRIDVQHERRAQSAQARMSAWVVMLAPVGYLGFAAVIDQSSVGVLFNTGVGRACFAIGALLDVIAMGWIHRLIGRDLQP